MRVYDENICIVVIRDGSRKTVKFRDIKDGDIVCLQNHQTAVAKGDAHMSEDASYDGYLFYDQEGESYFPEDFGAEVKIKEDNDEL